MQEGPKGPKRAQEGSLDDSIEDWRFHIQESPRGPKKRFYRGLQISYSKGPKSVLGGPLGNSIEDSRFHIQEGQRGPKRVLEEIL